MNIALFSDSHGAVSELKSAISLCENADLLIHLGDGWRDCADAAPGKSFTALGGNCDFAPGLPEFILTELGGVKTFMTHGHNYYVKSGLLRLRLHAQSTGAKLVLYGHTHIPRIENDGGVLLVCPGSVREGRFARLHISNGSITAETVKIP